jgi:D-lactate dehydrogenase
MYKIAFFDISSKEQKYLETRLKSNKNFSAIFNRNSLSPKSLEKVQDADIIASFVYSKIDKNIIDQLPKLKLITTMSTGFDHIDLKYAKEKGITVCNVPIYGEKTVAEHTFALLLSLSRKIPQSVENVRKLNFDLEDLRGFDLEGKTLGLIGIGHIGANVAKIAKGFDMKIIASDPKPDKKTIKKFKIELVNLENLLQTSDIISLHAPYNEHTHHLINKENINLIKPGVYIINTARGGLIETEALIRALDRNIIAGAGLDVLEEEYFIKEEKELLKNPNRSGQMLKTIIQNHLLLNNPKVIITPHNAFNSKEALQRILDTTVENIEAFEKQKPINIVK